mmetsp:Transcript_1497/g.1982  ORF Transcript_1497/g.1982 Transcript_1497/m.1982 type:complete len:99 (-) Transcript_1497:75-371(-)
MEHNIPAGHYWAVKLKPQSRGIDEVCKDLGFESVGTHPLHPDEYLLRPLQQENKNEDKAKEVLGSSADVDSFKNRFIQFAERKPLFKDRKFVNVPQQN